MYLLYLPQEILEILKILLAHLSCPLLSEGTPPIDSFAFQDSNMPRCPTYHEDAYWYNHPSVYLRLRCTQRASRKGGESSYDGSNEINQIRSGEHYHEEGVKVGYLRSESEPIHPIFLQRSHFAKCLRSGIRHVSLPCLRSATFSCHKE